MNQLLSLEPSQIPTLAKNKMVANAISAELEGASSKESTDFLSMILAQLNSKIAMGEEQVEISLEDIDAVLPLTPKLSEEVEGLSIERATFSQLLQLIEVLNDGSETKKFPVFSEKLTTLLKDAAILQEFKDVKSLKDLVKLGEKYDLGLEKLTITTKEIDTLEKKYPTLAQKEFFQPKKAIISSESILNTKKPESSMVLAKKEEPTPLKDLMKSLDTQTPKESLKPEVKEIKPEVKAEVSSSKESTPKASVIENTIKPKIAETLKEVQTTPKDVSIKEPLNKPIEAKENIPKTVIEPKEIKPSKVSAETVEKTPKESLKAEVKPEVKAEVKPEVKAEVSSSKESTPKASVIENTIKPKIAETLKEVQTTPKDVSIKEPLNKPIEAKENIPKTVIEPKEIKPSKVSAETVEKTPKESLKAEVKPEVKAEVKPEVKAEVSSSKESTPKASVIENTIKPKIAETLKEVQTTPKDVSIKEPLNKPIEAKENIPKTVIEPKEIKPSKVSAETVEKTPKESLKAEVKPEVKAEVKPEVKAEVKPEVKAEVKPEVKAEVSSSKESTPKASVIENTIKPKIAETLKEVQTTPKDVSIKEPLNKPIEAKENIPKTVIEPKEIKPSKVSAETVENVSKEVKEEAPKVTPKVSVENASKFNQSSIFEQTLQAVKPQKPVDTMQLNKEAIVKLSESVSESEMGASENQGESDTKNENRQNTLIKEIAKTATNQPKTTIVKQTMSQFAQDFKEQVENYKPPLMKVQMALNPKNLGEVEVTLVNRGNALHVNFTSTSQTMNLFVQNQAEFKNSLVNMGFTNLEMNFSDQRESKNNQGGDNSKFSHQGEELEEFSNEMTSLDMVIPDYA